MASARGASTLESLEDQHGGDSDVKPQIVYEWDDVTDAFGKAPEQMAMGEMIFSESFSLYTAMSAIKMMDPRMDIGCGVVKNAKEVLLPSALSDQQVVNIMDQLLACEMSWLDAHTLPQTVFSCVYAQRLAEIPRPDLFCFLRLQIASMDMIATLIVQERVAEEEDFVSWTFGFRLSPLPTGVDVGVDDVLRDMLEETEEFFANTGDEEPNLKDSIMNRIKFRVQFYRVLSFLTKASLSETTEVALELLNELRDATRTWESCSSDLAVDQDFIDHIFDASINRHLVTSTPPRTMPLLSVNAAFKYLNKLITEIFGVVTLRTMTLPQDISRQNEDKEPGRCSLHVAIHAVESFCAEQRPNVLTRSLLSRLMLPGKHALALFGTKGADYLGLISTDMGFRESLSNAELVEPYKRLIGGITGIFKCMCRNRSRQRRQILHVLRWWDHYSSAANSSLNSPVEVNGVPGLLGSDQKPSQAESGMFKSSKATHSKEEMDYFESKTPLQIVSYEVSARLLIQHLLLGFEVELYQEYEYAAVFFYVGYTLTAMAHATASFTKTGRKEAAFHPLRLALYVMDEARLWLCRALYSTLEALSSGDQWDYSCSRSKQDAEGERRMFGSEGLWYEQRFAVINGLRNGPAFADYSSYLGFKTMQDESLRSGEVDTDSVSLRLREAASGFLAARRNAEKAKRAAEQCGENYVSREVMKIARVAIANSLVVSRLLNSYKKPPEHGSQKRWTVLFKFSSHQHFPVIEVVAKE